MILIHLFFTRVSNAINHFLGSNTLLFKSNFPQNWFIMTAQWCTTV